MARVASTGIRLRTRYARAFARLGVPLRPRDAMGERTLAAAERRLGVKLPRALRDFYMVSGKERRLNQAVNHLLPPARWLIDDGKLVFMEDLFGSMVWGVEATATPEEDPLVQVTLGALGDEKDAPRQWLPEPEGRCSVFLEVTLHLQALCGPHRVAVLRRDPRPLVGRPWRLVGEALGLTVYQHGALSLLVGRDDEGWKVYARGRGRAVDELGAALGAKWKAWNEA